MSNYKDLGWARASYEDTEKNYMKAQLRISIINLLSVYVMAIVSNLMAFLTIKWGY